MRIISTCKAITITITITIINSIQYFRKKMGTLSGHI